MSFYNGLYYIIIHRVKMNHISCTKILVQRVELKILERIERLYAPYITSC